MQVSDIELKIQEYGASAGMRACVVTISNDAEKQTPAAIIEDIKTYLGDELFEQMLTGRLHLTFRGDGVDPVAHREDLMEFLQEGLSKASLDYQVKTLKLQSHELRPPFLEIYTQGSEYTGTEMFYENFNYVVIEAPPLDEDPPQPFGLVEAAKHAFATFVFRVNEESDWDTIYTKYFEPKYVPEQRARIFLIPAEGPRGSMIAATQAAANIALKEGVRCGGHLGLAIAEPV